MAICVKNNGLQRKRELYSDWIVCCVVTSGRVLISIQLLLGLGAWISEGQQLYGNEIVCCVVTSGQVSILIQPLLGLGAWTSEGKKLHSDWIVFCVVTSLLNALTAK